MSDDFKVVEDYDKVFYDVLTREGAVIKECWPNAGFYCAVDGSGRKWKCSDVKVRESRDVG